MMEKQNFLPEEYEEMIEWLWTANSMAIGALKDPSAGGAQALEYLLEAERLCRLHDLGRAIMGSGRMDKTDEKIFAKKL